MDHLILTKLHMRVSRQVRTFTSLMAEHRQLVQRLGDRCDGRPAWHEWEIRWRDFVNFPFESIFARLAGLSRSLHVWVVSGS